MGVVLTFRGTNHLLEKRKKEREKENPLSAERWQSGLPLIRVP